MTDADALATALDYHNVHERRGDRHCTHACADAIYDALADRLPAKADLDDAELEAFLDDLYQRGVDTAPEVRDALARGGYRIVRADGARVA